MRTLILIVICCPGLAMWACTVSMAGSNTPADRQPRAETGDACRQAALDAELLRSVRHRTLRVREEEADAYYQVLARARDVSYHVQQSCAEATLAERRRELPGFRDNPERDFPLFVDLFKNPDRYHGHPVTFRGTVRKLTSYPAGENAWGLTTLHEAWLFADDSQSNPVVVVCTSVPEVMPRGDNLVQPASATGYFFKLYGYPARDTLRVAPLILAQRMQWYPVEKPRQATSLYVYGGIAAAMLLFVVLVWNMGRHENALRKQRLQREQ